MKLFTTSRRYDLTSTVPARHIHIAWLLLSLVMASILSESATAKTMWYGAPYYFTLTGGFQLSPSYAGPYNTIGDAEQGFQTQYLSQNTQRPCVISFPPLDADEQRQGYFVGIEIAGPCNEVNPGSGYISSTGQFYNPTKNLGSGCSYDGGEGGCGGAPIQAGDPINVSTGNKYLQEDDYDGSPWLTFRRFYNSSIAVASTAMGAQWRHTFDHSLEITGTPTTSIVLFRPDGNQETFTKANGVWTTDPDISDTLTETDNAQGVVTGYTVFIGALRQFETYDTNGLLQTVTDETGVGITLTYSTTQTAPAVAPAPGLLLTVTDPKGRQLNFTYNSNGDLTQVTEPDGGTLSYAHDASGNLLTVQYPDTKTRQYIYNESALTGGANLPNAMTGIVDEAGVRYENSTYDSTGRATSSSLAGSVGTTQITYNSDGTSTVLYPLGTSENAGYSPTTSGLNQEDSLSQSCGNKCNQPWQTRTYDTNGHPASFIDFNNNLTTTLYDNNGLLDQQVDASGTTNQRTTSTTWNTALRVPLQTTVVNASGVTVANTEWVYNTSGQPVARCEIDPAQGSSYTCSATGNVPSGVRRWTYTYCTAVNTQCPLIGLRLSVTGPRTDLSQITNYSYYTSNSSTNCGTPGAACHKAGDLYQIKDALGYLTTYASYDADGRTTRITDANGTNTDMTYTPRGWLATRTVGGTTTTFGYDAMGNVASVKDPSGIITIFTYDAAHRLTDITDAQGNYVQYTLDADGNVTKETIFDNSGKSHKSLSRTFNSLDQLTSVIDGLNNSIFNTDSSYYDGNGNLVRSSDAFGTVRLRSYDALNRLSSSVDDYTDIRGSATTTFSYDSLDRLTQVTDPSSLNTTYQYDGLSDSTGQTSPDTGTTARTFDAAGNVLTATDAKGIVVAYTYDAQDRRLSASHPDSTQNITYTYDEPNSTTGCSSSYPIGHLTRINESTVTTVYCYDAQGRVIQKQQTVGTTTNTTSYTYTAAGRLSGVVYPRGTQVSYTRDTDGHIQTVAVTPPGGTVSTAVSSVTYQPFGPVSGYTLGNGQAITRTYDANYRLTDLTSPAFTLHVARDAMGNITAMGNAPGANPATETYSYDPLYRLTAITEADGSTLEGVTYNQTGDRLTKTGNGLVTGTYSYNANTHQLIATGSYARAVDADGNTTAITAASGNLGFGYNARNRLAVAQVADSTVGSYTYDALGERIQKVSGTASENYSYDEDQQLLGEQGATNRDYIWMDGIPVANVDTTGTTSTLAYVTADQLGAPQAIADTSGNTLWQLPYQGNAWDELAPTSNGYTYNLRLPGQYFDTETGLSNNINRDYDSGTGSYIEFDPLGLKAGPNGYAYVGGNTLNNIDPWGLIKWTGTFDQGGLVIGAGAIGASFDLTSECVDGKQAEINVAMLNGAAGFGPKWNPVTGDRGKISFHDSSDTINPELAAGPAGVLGMGATVGKLSIGYTRIRLGHLYSDSVDSAGFDVGATIGVGSSWVTKTTWKNCGCGH